MAFHGKPILKLRSVAWNMGSRSVTCHPTGDQSQPEKPILDLAAVEGWKAELTLVWIIYQNGLPVHR